MRVFPRVVVLLAGLAPAAPMPLAAAQLPLHTFDGDSPGDLLGASVSGAGDVNGDGYADVIAGAPGDDDGGVGAGSARVFSGLDGTVLFTFHGSAPGGAFGHSVGGAGDVNGDGRPDLIVGAPYTTLGSASVFSGLDGALLHTFTGSSQSCHFGGAVSGAGDVDGDGHDDLIVGAWSDDDHGADAGSARVFSGVDGSTLYTFHGSVDDLFGISVDGAGDVDGDGHDDLIVGSLYSSNVHYWGGSVHVFSGADGGVLYVVDGDSIGEAFGISVAGAGDVDGDGFDDLIVGADDDDASGTWAGTAHVLSGPDGSVIHTFYGDSPHDHFGHSVAGAGDVNGDGHADLIVGAYGDDENGSSCGSARIFSGLDGIALFTLFGDSPGDRFGESVGGAGDVDGDGFDDLVAGARFDDDNGAESGRVRVFAPCDDLGARYCSPAVPNSSGHSAVIAACGSDHVDDARLMLRATELPAGKFGYFLTSTTQGFVANPGGSQGDLCLGGSIGRYKRPGEVLSSGAAGNFLLIVDPADTPQPNGSVSIVAGETWCFQAWFRDTNPTPTSNFTDAVAVTFQ